jgi:hypothetical protein
MVSWRIVDLNRSVHCSYDSRCAGLYLAIYVFVVAAAAPVVAPVGRSSAAAQHCGLLPRGKMLIHIARKVYGYTDSRHQEQL